MKNWPFFFVSVFFYACTPTIEKVADTISSDTIGFVEIFDKEANQYIDSNAKIKPIAQGFKWSEGTLWVESLNALLFSDVHNNIIYKWTEKDSTEVYLKPSGYTGEIPKNGETGSNGLKLSSQGKLILCQHGDRRLAEMQSTLEDPKATFKTIAGDFMGKKFSSPNDVFVLSSDTYIFTDPPYGLMNQDKDSTKELQQNGVYFVKGGKVKLLIDTLTRPNGLIITNDKKHLIVANSDPQKAYWAVYDFDTIGNVTNGRVLLDVSNQVPTHKGLPDGMIQASNGIIYATGPGGVWLFNQQYKTIARITLKRATANVTIDEKKNMLYVANHDLVIQISLRKN
jgi:gluconolactonase